MEIERVEEVVIVGAGICGLATAVALKRVGIQAVVLERWDRRRAAGAALTLSQNAWLALDALGVAHKLTPLYAPLNKSINTNVGDGATQEVSVPGADSGVGPRPVHRKALLEALAEELSINGWLAHCCPPNGRWNYHKNQCNQNMTARSPKMIQKEVAENYAKDFPPIYLDVVLHSDLSSLTWAPLMLRLPWDVIFGNLSKGTVTVAGDAMHPMTPDLGQGGCSALEDAVVLGRHIGESFIKNGRLVSQEVTKAIERDVKERKWRTAGLITGSYLSGLVQQDGSSWWWKFFRDVIFYKFIFRRLGKVTKYDCGKLPKLSYSNGSDNQIKKTD